MTETGLANKWRRLTRQVALLSPHEYPSTIASGEAFAACADELDSAKLQLVQDIKALPAYRNGPSGQIINTVDREAVLKLIREILG